MDPTSDGGDERPSRALCMSMTSEDNAVSTVGALTQGGREWTVVRGWVAESGTIEPGGMELQEECREVRCPQCARTAIAHSSEEAEGSLNVYHWTECSACGLVDGCPPMRLEYLFADCDRDSDLAEQVFDDNDEAGSRDTETRPVMQDLPGSSAGWLEGQLEADRLTRARCQALDAVHLQRLAYRCRLAARAFDREMDRYKKAISRAYLRRDLARFLAPWRWFGPEAPAPALPPSPNVRSIYRAYGVWG